MPDSPHDILRYMLHGHRGVIAVIHAYLDETGTHSTALVPSMAAYIFDADKALEFTKQWDRVVTEKLRPHGVKYFHATDFFLSQRKKPFDALSNADVNEVVALLTGLIKQTAMAGFVRFISTDNWKEFLTHAGGAQKFVGSPYTACGMSCVDTINKVLNDRGYTGEVFYYFESGNEGQSELAHFLTRMVADPELKKQNRCSGFGFFDKDKMSPLQCADFLAWEWQKMYRDTMRFDKNESRTELQDLMKAAPHFMSGFSSTSITIQAMANAFRGIMSNKTGLL
jgi:hypothetical protein